MIKVYKDSQVPSSLKTTSAYDGEDVKRQLLADQYEKCYICERKRDTDFEIEHHKSQTNYPDLIQDWNNLFMGCGYCNRKKACRFDNILNPKDYNIEDEIELRIDFENKKAIFHTNISDSQHYDTITLLNQVFNGSNRIRNTKEERFLEQAISAINRFSDLVYRYLANPVPATEKAVRDELSIDKEWLGFKYWVIRDQPALYAVFAQDVIWNK